MEGHSRPEGDHMKALITGASRGIGEAIAGALAKEGYDLYLTCDKTYDKLEEVADRLRSEYGVDAWAYQTDMSNETAVKDLFNNIDELDVLVNNAGISYIGLLQDMTYEEWKSVLSVNLDSVFLTCREAVPMMVREGRGCIINISSVWGEHGASMEVAYSASKGGMNAFTKALARELAPSKVRVNAIACGVIDTDMNKCFSTEEMKDIVEDIPADRLGESAEIAETVVMLTKAPDYLTGQVITVDGGYV